MLSPCVGMLLGALVIADTITPEAPTYTVVQALQKMGLSVMLLTGDNRRTAHAIAEKVRLHVYGCSGNCLATSIFHMHAGGNCRR